MPPLRADHVPRPALVERLSRGSSRLTLLVAPAGFGKTTALVEWLTSLSVGSEPPRIAFLALDAFDADTDRLIRALQRLLVDQPTHVALDDFHWVDQRPEIVAFLASWIEHPDRPRLVVASRRRPDWPLARWRGRGDVHEIDARRLRFVAAETRAFFRARAEGELDSEWVDRWHRRTEGWPAALQLALAAGADASLAEALPGDERPISEYLAEYLTTEVLDQLDADRRRALEALSILDAFCPRLAVAVAQLGDEDPAAVVRDLERLHLPIVRLDAAGSWFRFHPLFVELLRRRLGRSRAKAAHRRASAWFDAEGDVERALEHALLAEAVDIAEALLERHGRTLIDRGEGLVVARAVERMGRPLETLDGRVVVHLGWAAFLLHRPEMLRRVVEVLEARRVSGRLDAEITARLDTLLGAVARGRGDLDAARRHFTSALDAAPADDPPLRSTLALQLGITLTFALELDRAAEVFERCLALDPDPGAMTWLGSASCLAQVRASQGRLGQAEALCRRALEPLATIGSRPAEALVLRTLGRIHLERGEWRRSAERLDVALDRSRRHGFDELVALTALWQAELARSRGDRPALDRALARVDQLPTADRLPPLQRWWSRALAIHRALDDHDLDDASARGHGLPRPSGRPSLAGVHLQLAFARLDAMRGATEQAASDLRALVDAARARGAREIEIEALVWRTWLEARRGSGRRAARRRALDALGRALRLAVDEGHVRPFLVAPAAVLAPVLEAAGRELPERPAAHAARLLEALRARCDAEGHGDRVGLTDRESEVLGLVAEGLPDRRIAESLGIAPSTVKTHLRNLFDKLEVRRRTQAVARGRALGLV